MSQQAHKPVEGRYGKLTVLEFQAPFGWRVRCDCGKEKFLTGNNLRKGGHRSCGCARYDRHRELLRERHAKERAAKGLPPIRPEPLKTGTRCWCCRSFTGKSGAVVLCRACEGKKP